MTTKRLTLSAKAPVQKVGQWVKQGGNHGDTEGLAKGLTYTARLTLDVTPELRKHIKLAAVTEGKTVAEILREVLEREFANPSQPQP
jgi:hypothetical protein